VQRIEDGQAQVKYSVAGRSEGRVMPCVIYTMHKEHEFFGLASKARLTVFLFGPQNRHRRFGDLGLKIIVMVS
jgi:hypothetical protein